MKFGVALMRAFRVRYDDDVNALSFTDIMRNWSIVIEDSGIIIKLMLYCNFLNDLAVLLLPIFTILLNTCLFASSIDLFRDNRALLIIHNSLIGHKQVDTLFGDYPVERLILQSISLISQLVNSGMKGYILNSILSYSISRTHIVEIKPLCYLSIEVSSGLPHKDSTSSIRLTIRPNNIISCINHLKIIIYTFNVKIDYRSE